VAGGGWQLTGAASQFNLMGMVKAVFPGSFDPPTFGHLNVIERARSIFETVYVVVAVNRSKNFLFNPEERVAFMEELVQPWPNVLVRTCDSLVVEFARQHDCKVLLRGVRSVQDFSYEFELSIMNKGLGPEIETFFMPTDPQYFVLRSSAIKELASFGGDVSAMVPPVVAKALERYNSRSQALRIDKDSRIR
jgi:pantetheine-phosphate adenylyltransferase